MTTKLKPLFLGTAIGVVEGLYMVLFAWTAWIWDYGTAFIQQIAVIFYGYAPTFIGGILGGLWGFVDGFIFGLLIAWIYNLCTSCCDRKGQKIE